MKLTELSDDFLIFSSFFVENSDGLFEGSFLSPYIMYTL